MHNSGLLIDPFCPKAVRNDRYRLFVRLENFTGDVPEAVKPAPPLVEATATAGEAPGGPPRANGLI